MTIDTSPQTNTLGEWASLGIQKYLNKVLSHEAAVLQDEDPEELHQMRVGMRRLRSAVTGFAPVLDLPKAASDDNIGKIARRLGELRDIDVMIEALNNQYYPTLTEAEKPTLDKVLIRLVKQRGKAFKKVQATLAHQKYQNLKQDLQNWLDFPVYTPIEKLPIMGVLPDLLLPQVSQLLLHQGWLFGIDKLETESESTENSSQETTPKKTITKKKLEKLLTTHGDVLHSLRKQAKRVRYLMALFTDFYGSTYQAYLQDMKDLQECLGDIQDTMVLEAVLVAIVRSDLKKSLPTLSNQMSQKRYESWQSWTQLQRRYLNPVVRQDFHLTLLRPPVDSDS